MRESSHLLRAGALCVIVLAGLASTGCGIDAKKAVDDVFNVDTTSTTAAPPPTTTAPTTTTTPIGPTEPSPARTVPVPAPEPVAAIPIETADRVARTTATATARSQGFEVPAASWQVSCHGDETSWTCPVTRQGCAGSITVHRTTPDAPVTGEARGLGCVD
jgi:hypothetical protein